GQHGALQLGKARVRQLSDVTEAGFDTKVDLARDGRPRQWLEAQLAPRSARLSQAERFTLVHRSRLGRWSGFVNEARRASQRHTAGWQRRCDDQKPRRHVL